MSWLRSARRQVTDVGTSVRPCTGCYSAAGAGWSHRQRGGGRPPSRLPAQCQGRSLQADTLGQLCPESSAREDVGDGGGRGLACEGRKHCREADGEGGGVFKVHTRLYLQGFGPGWSLSVQILPPANDLTAQALCCQLVFLMFSLEIKKCCPGGKRPKLSKGHSACLFAGFPVTTMPHLSPVPHTCVAVATTQLCCFLRLKPLRQEEATLSSSSKPIPSEPPLPILHPRRCCSS